MLLTETETKMHFSVFIHSDGSLKLKPSSHQCDVDVLPFHYMWVCVCVFLIHLFFSISHSNSVSHSHYRFSRCCMFDSFVLSLIEQKQQQQNKQKKTSKQQRRTHIGKKKPYNTKCTFYTKTGRASIWKCIYRASGILYAVCNMEAIYLQYTAWLYLMLVAIYWYCLNSADLMICYNVHKTHFNTVRARFSRSKDWNAYIYPSPKKYVQLAKIPGQNAFVRELS